MTHNSRRLKEGISMKLSNKVVLVTGSSLGIDQAITFRLANVRANLIIN